MAQMHDLHTVCAHRNPRTICHDNKLRASTTLKPAFIGQDILKNQHKTETTCVSCIKISLFHLLIEDVTRTVKTYTGDGMEDGM